MPKPLGHFEPNIGLASCLIDSLRTMACLGHILTALAVSFTFIIGFTD